VRAWTDDYSVDLTKKIVPRVEDYLVGLILCHFLSLFNSKDPSRMGIAMSERLECSLVLFVKSKLA
jgi:hypothetical protein